MIRVTIELLPFGEEARRSTLATVNIANQGTTNKKGETYYAVEKCNADGSFASRLYVWHRRSDGVAALVRKAL